MDIEDHISPECPEPIWPDAPRHMPGIPLPKTAFIPGGNRANRLDIVNLVSSVARGVDADYYLYGIDLYHQGYLWEAHEAWEQVWQPLQRESLGALFYQGLIFNAAAQLKSREGRPRGVRRLSQNGFRRLQHVLNASQSDVVAGLDLARLLDEMEGHYRALWRATGALNGPAPRLILVDTVDNAFPPAR